MKTEARRRATTDRYLDLVRAFPLRPIRTQSEFDAAMRVLERLVVRDDLDEGETDYVQVLTTLVERYEAAQPALPRASAVDVLKHYMSIRKMTTADLGRVLGHSSLASAILLGKRQISKAHAQTLAAHFGTSSGVFID